MPALGMNHCNNSRSALRCQPGRLLLLLIPGKHAQLQPKEPSCMGQGGRAAQLPQRQSILTELGWRRQEWSEAPQEPVVGTLLNSTEGSARAAWESSLLQNFSSLNNSKAPHPTAAIVVREGIPTRTMISTTFFRWKKKTGNAAQQKQNFHSSSSSTTSLLPKGSRLTCLQSAVQQGCIFSSKDPKAVMWWKPPRLEIAMGGSSLCTLERAAH